MMPRSGLGLALLALVVSGCASSAPQLYCYKAGASNQEFFQDDYQGRRETSMTGVQTTYTPPNWVYPRGAVTSTPSTQVNAGTHVVWQREDTH
jgi:hypothetical protein